jgi:hypothetical protein
MLIKKETYLHVFTLYVCKLSNSDFTYDQKTILDLYNLLEKIYTFNMFNYTSITNVHNNALWQVLW